MRIYKPYTHNEDTKKMLFGALILVGTILATNGYPSSSPNSDIVLQNSGHREVIHETAGDQQIVLQSPGHQLYVYRTAGDEQLVIQSPGRQEYIYRTAGDQQHITQNSGHQNVYQTSQKSFNDDYDSHINSQSNQQHITQNSGHQHVYQTGQKSFNDDYDSHIGSQPNQQHINQNSGHQHVYRTGPKSFNDDYDSHIGSQSNQQHINQNSGQQHVHQIGQTSFNDDYDSHVDSQSGFVEQQADFTISCAGENKICTSKNNCVNGYVHVTNNVAHSLSGKVQQCKVHSEVCCTIAEFQGANTKTHTSEQDLRGDTNNIGFKFDRPFTTAGQGQENRGTVNLQPADDIAVQNAFAAAIPVQVGCAAALICVEEKFCTADGTISPQPVTFSNKQLFQRVPLSTCKNPDNGIIGKCCRDPNYVDPWPTGNLPANYSGGFDEQGFPTFLNIAKVKPVVPTKVGTKSPPRPQIHPPVQQRPEPTLLPENSVVSSEVLLPPIEHIPAENQESKFTIGQASQICGVRNKVPQKHEESETAFAEIPWQAMVLHTNEKKILCSGALVSAYEVLTAANCVERMSPNDVSIKLGEWKLGYELKQEEPLPYQIINVSYINVHPGYVKGHGDHDLAMLHLQQPAEFNYHINPLCMPTRSLLQPNRPCITTGWGKSILQAHYAGAIMHAVNLDVLSSERCKEQVAHTDLNVNSVDGTICATTKEERNNVCETDIGGPLACENENGVYELTGIYSQDTGCLPTNQVAIFAPLDNTWIKETMLKSTPSNSITFTNQRESSTEYPGSLLVNDYRQSTLSTDNQYLPPN